MIIFSLLFLIFLPGVLNLRLFLDDHVLIWPALTKTYWQDFINYTYGFGLYRPFRLVFLYYPLYTIYTFAPWIPYLFLFAIHLITGIVIYRIFKNYVEEKFSLLLSLSYIVFPFFTEQYAWIATGATIVNLILFLQLYIALISNKSVKSKLLWLLILQTVGVFTYDTLFFNFLLLGLVLYQKRASWQLSIKQVLIWVFLFALPSILYAFLRSFIFYPHNPSTLRELRLSDLSRILSIEWHNVSTFIGAQKFLFLGEGSWISFWQYNLVQGFHALANNFLTLGIFEFLLISLTLFLFGSKSIRYDKIKTPIIILLLIAILSLLPAFLVTVPSFPFRVIALSAWCILAFTLFTMKKISRYLAYVIALSAVFIGIIFSLKMLADMRNVYNDDDKMTTQIVKELDQRIPRGNKTTVIIQNMPFSTNTSFNYGEYLGGCVRVDWCVQMELAKKTDKVKNVIIDPTSFPKKTVEIITFVYDQNHKSLVLKNE